MSELDKIKQAIKNGDRSGARRALISLLSQDPDDVLAWELLATVIDDTAKQIDCYRQILRANPRHRQAAARLRALAENTAETSSKNRSADGKTPVLRCPKCGGTMTVHFAGELHDKRAVCAYCGTELDLPDTFQIHEKPISTQAAAHVDRETTKSLDSSLSETPPLLGAFLRHFVTTNVKMTPEPSGETVSQQGMVIDPNEWEDLASIKGLIETMPDTTSGPVPPEEKVRCPKCNAVASVNEERCQWCGTSFQNDRQE